MWLEWREHVGEEQEMRAERNRARPWGPVGQDEDTGFSSMCERKAWKSLQQGVI